MPVIFRNKQRTHFQNIYTGEESWFLFEYSQQTQWILSKEDLLTKALKTNMKRKIMLTVFLTVKDQLSLRRYEV